MKGDLVNLRNACVELGRLSVLGNLTLTVARGELLVVVGESGVGKTTLLELFAGEIIPTGGQKEFHGKAISYALQKTLLVPWRDVIGNVSFGMELQGTDKVTARFCAKEVLNRLGLESWSSFSVNQLSGGMAQKVAIARAICTPADLLLFDEPFASMDKASWMAFGRELRKEASRGVGVVVATHLIESAVEIGTRIVVLSGVPAGIAFSYKVSKGKLFDADGVQKTENSAESVQLVHRNLGWDSL